MSAELRAYKATQRRLWSAGDYAVTACRFEEVAAQLVTGCAIGPGQRVLDIAAGDGNGALAAVAAGASAAACDLTPSLVADAEQLPVADGSFDAAVSIFGLVLAPRPQVAISEAFRVTRSGGIVGLASWTPGSAAARFGAIGARHLPAPAQPLPSPHEWGDEETARERFGRHCAAVRFDLGTVRWSWPSAAAAREELEESNGFVAAARADLPAERLIALVDDLVDLMRSLSSATDGGVTYDAEYARVVGRKPG
jgi:SAM-dependent methyltransferase